MQAALEALHMVLATAASQPHALDLPTRLNAGVTPGEAPHLAHAHTHANSPPITRDPQVDLVHGEVETT